MASSFLVDTLEAAGVDGGERCSPNLSQLSTQSDELKLEIMTYLKGKYIDFDIFADKTSTLHKRYEELNASLTSTTQQVKTELQSKGRVSSDYAGLTNELEKVTETLRILELLLEIHKLYQAVSEELTRQDYQQTSAALKKMKSALRELKKGPPGLEITKALGMEHTLLTETLRQMMKDDWLNLVKVSKPDASQPDEKMVTICLCKSKADKLSGLCQTSHDEGMLRLRLTPLAEAILVCFDWIVNHPKTTVTEETTDVDVSLCITKTSDKVVPSSPAVVFKLLYNLIKPLAQSLQVSFSTDNQKVSLMSELSAVCGDQPIDVVIKGCLAPSVPTSHSDLSKYKEVVTATEKLEGFFTKVGFISPECKLLTSYMSNLDVLFANKKCQQILFKARQLMKADLYNTVQLKPGDDCVNWASFVAKRDTSSDNSDIHSQMAKLSENTLKFPACAISETVVQLMDLAHSMMEEACSTANAVCSSQIVYAVRSMFELYTSVVSDYHRHSIQSLPQVTGLYYNNCMFLSHQLIMLGSQYKAALSKVMNDGSAVTFVDLVPLLRSLGTESFLDQLQSQKETLLECLRGAEGFKTMEVEERFQRASQSVKQCLHQLSHLKKVWAEVLPLSNYCKAVGHLLGCVIKDMTHSIQSLEDMSADDTTKLHLLISQVESAAPELFPGDRSAAVGFLHKNTSGWTRLKELALVLTSSMHDILDRWADGKGPLAEEFSPEQVKSLIRALFQNTERRAAALAKIH